MLRALTATIATLTQLMVDFSFAPAPLELLLLQLDPKQGSDEALSNKMRGEVYRHLSHTKAYFSVRHAAVKNAVQELFASSTVPCALQTEELFHPSVASAMESSRRLVPPSTATVRAKALRGAAALVGCSFAHSSSDAQNRCAIIALLFDAFGAATGAQAGANATVSLWNLLCALYECFDRDSPSPSWSTTPLLLHTAKTLRAQFLTTFFNTTVLDVQLLGARVFALVTRVAGEGVVETSKLALEQKDPLRVGCVFAFGEWASAGVTCDPSAQASLPMVLSLLKSLCRTDGLIGDPCSSLAIAVVYATLRIAIAAPRQIKEFAVEHVISRYLAVTSEPVDVIIHTLIQRLVAVLHTSDDTEFLPSAAADAAREGAAASDLTQAAQSMAMTKLALHQPLLRQLCDSSGDAFLATQVREIVAAAASPPKWATAFCSQLVAYDLLCAPGWFVGESVRIELCRCLESSSDVRHCDLQLTHIARAADISATTQAREGALSLAKTLFRASHATQQLEHHFKKVVLLLTAKPPPRAVASADTEEGGAQALAAARREEYGESEGTEGLSRGQMRRSAAAAVTATIFAETAAKQLCARVVVHVISATPPNTDLLPHIVDAVLSSLAFADIVGGLADPAIASLSALLAVYGNTFAAAPAKQPALLPWKVQMFSATKDLVRGVSGQQMAPFGQCLIALVTSNVADDVATSKLLVAVRSRLEAEGEQHASSSSFAEGCVSHLFAALAQMWSLAAERKWEASAAVAGDAVVEREHVLAQLCNAYISNAALNHGFWPREEMLDDTSAVTDVPLDSLAAYATLVVQRKDQLGTSLRQSLGQLSALALSLPPYSTSLVDLVRAGALQKISAAHRRVASAVVSKHLLSLEHKMRVNQSCDDATRVELFGSLMVLPHVSLQDDLGTPQLVQAVLDGVLHIASIDPTSAAEVLHCLCTLAAKGAPVHSGMLLAAAEATDLLSLLNAPHRAFEDVVAGFGKAYALSDRKTMLRWSPALRDTTLFVVVSSVPVDSDGVMSTDVLQSLQAMVRVVCGYSTDGAAVLVRKLLAVAAGSDGGMPLAGPLVASMFLRAMTTDPIGLAFMRTSFHALLLALASAHVPSASSAAAVLALEDALFLIDEGRADEPLRQLLLQVVKSAPQASKSVLAKASPDQVSSLKQFLAGAPQDAARSSAAIKQHSNSSTATGSAPAPSRLSINVAAFN